jgi:hypothetical protein
MNFGLCLFKESFISWPLLRVVKKCMQINCIYFCKYCCFPADATYIDLFWKLVCIIYWYLIKILRTFLRNRIFLRWGLFFRSNIHTHRTKTCAGHSLKYRIWLKSVQPSIHYWGTHQWILRDRNHLYFQDYWKSVNLSKCRNRFSANTFSYKFRIWQIEIILEITSICLKRTLY